MKARPSFPGGSESCAAPRALLLAAFMLASCAYASSARAQMAVSLGTDAGITMSNPHARFVDPSTRWQNLRPTPALGIDVAGYWIPSRAVAAGFAFTPTLFWAGPQPSPGLNFVFGPRFVWRAGAVHVAADAGVALSAYEDFCSVATADRRARCPLTRPHEPTAVGYALGLSPLVRVATDAFGNAVQVGPAFRYQRARFASTDGGPGLDVQIFQAVLAVRWFVDLTAWSRPPATAMR